MNNKPNTSKHFTFDDDINTEENDNKLLNITFDNLEKQNRKRKYNDISHKTTNSTYEKSSIMTGGFLYEKTRDTTARHDDWGITKRRMTFRSTNNEIDNFVTAIDKTREFIREIYQEEIVPLKKTNKKIIMEIKHDGFAYNMYIHLMAANCWTEDMIWSHFEHICQSRKNDPNFESQPEHKIEVSLDIYEVIQGGSKNSKLVKRANLKQNKHDLKLKNVTDFSEYRIAKNSIISFENEDEHCLIRAIIIGKFLADSNLNITKFPEMLEKETQQLVRELGFSNVHGGISNIKEIEEYLIDYQITLLHTNTIIWRHPIYVNFHKKFTKYIYIVYDQTKKHFSTIKSMQAFLNKSYYCHKCKIGYDHRNRHICENTCKACNKINCSIESGIKQQCFDCKIMVNSEKCFELHKNICKVKKKCTECNYDLSKRHVCGDNNKWCKGCDKSVEIDHICFIKPEIKVTFFFPNLYVNFIRFK